MTNTIVPATMLLWSVIGLLSGCTSPSPLREDYGESITAIKRAQQAGVPAHPRPPREGTFDGQAAQLAIQSYLATFDQAKASGGSSLPAQPPMGFNDAIGAMGGAAMGTTGAGQQ